MPSWGRRRIVTKRDVLADLKWALGWALSVAGVLSLWVLFLALVQGSLVFQKRTEHLNVRLTAGEIVRAYFGVALVGGLLLGWLRPWTRRHAGAVVAGMLVGTMVYAGVGLTFAPLNSDLLLTGLIAGVPVGGYLAHRWWRSTHD